MSAQAQIVADAIGAAVLTPHHFYFGSRLSERITKTPEGFLICRDVPIARTGWQEYTADEIGAEGGSDRRVRVYRAPEEVFSAAAIASTEGKPVTDQHPPVFVTAMNYGGYLRGHVQNVRASGLTDSEGERLLMADLVVMDAGLINKVENGLREISVGYSCDYVPIRGNDYAQRNIRVNHVAVVKSARAGNDVRIYDSQLTNAEEKEQEMAEPTVNPVEQGIGAIQSVMNFLKGLGFASPTEVQKQVRDAESEAVKRNEEAAEKGEERLERLNEKDDDDDVRAARRARGRDDDDRRKMGDDDDDDDDWRRRVTDLEEKLKSLAAGATEPEEEEEEGEEHEKARDDHDFVPVETQAKEDRPENPIPGAPQTVDALRKLRPVIARYGTRDDRIAFNKAMAAAKGRVFSARDSRVYGELARTRKPDSVREAEARAGMLTTDTNKAQKEAAEFVEAAKQFHKKNPGEVVLQMPGKKEAS